MNDSVMTTDSVVAAASAMATASALFADQFDGPARQNRTINGRSFLRIQGRCRIDGRIFWQYLEQKPDGFRSDVSPAERFAKRSHPCQNPVMFRQSADEALQAELGRLRGASFPLVAKLVEREFAVPRSTELPEGALFAVGDNIQWTAAVHGPIGADTAETGDLLARFQRGDMGTYGMVTSVTPTEDLAWLGGSGFLGPLVESWAAIASGNGLAKAEFVVGDESNQAPQYGGQDMRPARTSRRVPGEVISCWGLLRAGVAEKVLIFSPSRNSNV